MHTSINNMDSNGIQLRVKQGMPLFFVVQFLPMIRRHAGNKV